ncbi:lipid II-degrading bacteriocin [Pseudomonas plecoglossicida]
MSIELPALYTPFRAIAHRLLGKGQQAKVNINNIGISPRTA